MNGPMDFSNANNQRDFSDLIPHGTLAFGVIKVRPYNADAGIIETPSKPPKESRYLDCEITIEGGEHDKRKLWTNLGTAGSEGFINMGRSSIKAILEVGRGAGPNNMQGYYLNDYMELSGLKCAFKVKVAPGTQQYPNDKNEIAVFLSPVQPETEKDWNRLIAGDTKPAPDTVPARRAAPAGAAVPVAPAQPARWAAGPAQAPVQQAAPTAPVPPAAAAPAPAQPAVSPAAPPPWLPQAAPPQSDQG